MSLTPSRIHQVFMQELTVLRRKARKGEIDEDMRKRFQTLQRELMLLQRGKGDRDD